MNLVIDKKNMLILIACFIFVVMTLFTNSVYASDDLTLEQYIEKYPVQYYILTKSDHANGTKNALYSAACDFESTPNRVCGYIVSNGTVDSTISFCSDTPYKNSYYWSNGWYSWGGSFEKNSDGIYRTGSSTAIKKVNEYLTNVILFSSYDDAKTYILTGQINNALFEPEQKYEYSSAVEIPLMAQCQVNGDRFLFNCMQTESHNDYRLQINASVSLTPIYSNLTSKKYADTEQIFTSGKNEIGKYDNHDITFNVSFTTTDLLNGIDTSRTALGFKEFYNGYNILLPYKEATLSKIYFYARNVCGSKCSNWVKVTFDLITETSVYEEVESVSGSNVPSDTKKDSSEYYPSDYIYNDDEPYQGDNNGGILGYIKNGLGLVGNNSIIALIGNTFSFLPRELTTLLLYGGALLVAVGIVKVVTR